MSGDSLTRLHNKRNVPEALLSMPNKLKSINEYTIQNKKNRLLMDGMYVMNGWYGYNYVMDEGGRCDRCDVCDCEMDAMGVMDVIYGTDGMDGWL